MSLENNINSVAGVYALLKGSFKDIFQELMKAELDEYSRNRFKSKIWDLKRFLS
ncbi:MAG: hypothetical protein UHS54_11000 [Lachnospiraceae bacterium]|nr:hypothetical protein [Lachnospiraceae bacterium]